MMNYYAAKWLRRAANLALCALEVALIAFWLYLLVRPDQTPDATAALTDSYLSRQVLRYFFITLLLLFGIAHAVCFLATDHQLLCRHARADQVFGRALHTLLRFFVTSWLLVWIAIGQPLYCIGLLLPFYLLFATSLVGVRMLLYHAVQRAYRHGWQGFVADRTPQPLARYGNRLAKRTFDLLCAVCLLLTVFPLLFLVLTIVSKLKYRGPVLFRQACADRNKRPFWLYAFGICQSSRWARKLHLDAWARLINVFFGQLSIVGTKPKIATGAAWQLPHDTAKESTAQESTAQDTEASNGYGLEAETQATGAEAVDPPAATQQHTATQPTLLFDEPSETGTAPQPAPATEQPLADSTDSEADTETQPATTMEQPVACNTDTFMTINPKPGIINWTEAMQPVLGADCTDEWYQEHWSLTLDLYIILQQVSRPLRPKAQKQHD